MQREQTYCHICQCCRGSEKLLDSIPKITNFPESEMIDSDVMSDVIQELSFS